MTNTLYFDNSATTFPKPPSVAREMERCIREYCGNAGRGSHRLALLAAEKLYEARELAAEMFSCPRPDGVVFTLNATYALNMAINGLVKKDSHVLISDLEHNSVLRPVINLEKTKNTTYSVFSTLGNVIDNIRGLIRKETCAIICTHMSNITNRILPIEQIGRLAKQRGLTFIVDASQSAGVRRIDMERCNISALCMPGHKGLLGPQGVGMALFSPDALPEPSFFGGSGSMSREKGMPGILPDRLEAGTMPLPAVAGLCEGMRFVLEKGPCNIYRHECDVMGRIRRYFFDCPRIRTYSSGEGGIWLFNIRGISSQRTSAMLNEYGACTRPGIHCAPLAHSTLGTPEDGAVRASAGPLTALNEGEGFAAALERVLKTV